MALTVPLMYAPPANTEMPQEDWEVFVARIGAALSAVERRGDANSWERAQLIIDADHEASARPDMQGKKRWEIRHTLKQSLREYWAQEHLPHPKPSVISDARKLYEVWPEVFHFETKNLPYQHYRQMAVCSLPIERKGAIRAWAEDHMPTQSDLRQRIRAEVDVLKGVDRPDFDLKVSNHWVFQVEERADAFHGGLNALLYANLIHGFSEPGDTIIDPCAGGGYLSATLKRWKHFQSVTQAQHSGPRYPLMCDIAPCHPDIEQADARICLPFEDACATLAIIDPPYFKMAEGKYATLGETITQWLTDIRAVLRSVQRCLVPDGRVAIMTDDFVRKDQHEPLGHRMLALLEEEGWELVTTIYNFNRNWTAASPLEMARFKRARLLVNGIKTIQVALRPA